MAVTARLRRRTLLAMHSRDTVSIRASSRFLLMLTASDCIYNHLSQSPRGTAPPRRLTGLPTSRQPCYIVDGWPPLDLEQHSVALTMTKPSRSWPSRRWSWSRSASCGSTKRSPPPPTRYQGRDSSVVHLAREVPGSVFDSPCNPRAAIARQSAIAPPTRPGPAKKYVQLSITVASC